MMMMMKEDNNIYHYQQQLMFNNNGMMMMMNKDNNNNNNGGVGGGNNGIEMICQVCNSILSKPKTLRCDHSYCSDCLDLSLVDKSGVPGDTPTYTCVQCRIKTPARDLRVDDHLLQSLSEHIEKIGLAQKEKGSPNNNNNNNGHHLLSSTNSSSSSSSPSSTSPPPGIGLMNSNASPFKSNSKISYSNPSSNSPTPQPSMTPNSSYSPPPTLSTSPLLFSPSKDFGMSSSVSTPALSSYLSPTPLSPPPKSPLYKSTELLSPLLSPSKNQSSSINNNNNNNNTRYLNGSNGMRQPLFSSNGYPSSNNNSLTNNISLLPPLPSINTSSSSLLPNLGNSNGLSLSSSLLLDIDSSTGSLKRSPSSTNPLSGSQGSNHSRNGSINNLNLFSDFSNNNNNNNNNNYLYNSGSTSPPPPQQQQQLNFNSQSYQMYLSQQHQQLNQQQQIQESWKSSSNGYNQPTHQQQQQQQQLNQQQLNQQQQFNQSTLPTSNYQPYSLIPTLIMKSESRCMVHNNQEYQYYCFEDNCMCSLCDGCLGNHKLHRVQTYADIIALNNVENSGMRDIFLRYKNYLEVESDIVDSLAKYNPVEECKAQLKREVERILSESFNQIDRDFMEHRSRMDTKRERITKLLNDIELERSKLFIQQINNNQQGQQQQQGQGQGQQSQQQQLNSSGGHFKTVYETNQQKKHFNELFRQVNEVSSTENNDISWQFKYNNQLINLPKQQNQNNNTNNLNNLNNFNNNTLLDNYTYNLLRVSNLPYKCTLKFIYAIGGKGKQSVERYSINQNRWSYVSPMTNERNRISGVFDGRSYIYVFGGESGNVAFTTVERYNVYTDTWETVASLPSERSRHATIYDGRRYVYIIGGKDRWFTNHVDRFDLVTQEYVSLAPMKTPRSDLSAVYDGRNFIYAIGGFNGKALDIVERYDIAEDKWTRFMRMRKMRDGPGAVYDQRSDSIYLMGGSYGTKRISSSLDRYVVSTDPPRCDTMADMLKPIDVRNSVVYDAEDNVFVVGGYFSEVLADAYRYNIPSNQWTSLRPMNEPREGNALVYVTIDIN